MILPQYYTTVLRYNDGYTDKDFHDKIRENIEEKTAHLAYADWLDENGRDVEAGLIRNAMKPDPYNSFYETPLSSYYQKTHLVLLGRGENNKYPTGLFIPIHTLKSDASNKFLFYFSHIPKEHRDELKQKVKEQGVETSGDGFE